MKNILLLLLAVAVSFSFSCSSGNKSSSDKKDTKKSGQDWSTLEYHYRTGSVAPEYYYHYKVLVNNDKTAQFIFYYSYADTGFTQESFTITDSQLASLNTAVENSKVLDGNIPAASDNERPIGGSTQTLTVVIVNPDPNLDQAPKRIEIPSFPELKYRKAIDELYDVINGLIPAGMMEAAKSKKEEMSK